MSPPVHGLYETDVDCPPVPLALSPASVGLFLSDGAGHDSWDPPRDPATHAKKNPAEAGFRIQARVALAGD